MKDVGGREERGFGGVDGSLRCKQTRDGCRLEKVGYYLQLSIQDLVWVVLGPTRLAVVLVRSDLAIAQAYAWTVLPYFAGLALDHDTLVI